MAALSHNLSKPRQALLQILIAKHVMTETEVRKYRAVVVASYRVRVGLKTATFPGLVQARAAADDIEKHLKEGSVGDLNEAFQDMNAALKVMNFEVRSMQENGSLVHTMVNLTDDELSAKHGTRMNPADMEVFKKAIKAIGASDDGAGDCLTACNTSIRLPAIRIERADGLNAPFHTLPTYFVIYMGPSHACDSHLSCVLIFSLAVVDIL
jgi:hypothetical protein